ncbi:response regulator transcription factor [Bacteroidota bacterium]
MKKKILLVEDDRNLGTVLKEFLTVKNYSIDHSLNGAEGENMFQKKKYDLVLLDVMMPEMDGFTLAERIRKIDNQTPIIFLTAKAMQQDKIKGLKIGADDYITKPFNTEELLLRINAVLKRTSDNKQSIKDADQFKIGKYNFNYKKRILSINKATQKLTSKEAELLKLLCLNKNDLLERNVALQTIWRDDNYFSGRSMDVYITKLRSYLKDDRSIEISNVHGMGFKLISD